MKVEHLKVVGLEDAIRGMRNPKNSWKYSDSYIVPNVMPGTSEFDNKLKTFPISLFTDDKGYAYRLLDKTQEQINYNPWTQEYIIDKEKVKKNFDFDLSENPRIKADNVVVIGEKDLDLMQRLISHDNTVINGGEPNSKFLRDICVYLDLTASIDFWKEFDTYKVGTVSDSCSTMHTITMHPITIDNFSLYDLRDKDVEFLKTSIDYFNNEVLNDKSLNDLEKTRIMSKLNHFGFEQKRTILLNYNVIKNMDIWRMGHKLKEWRILINVYFKNLPYIESLFFKNPYVKKNNNEKGEN